MKRLLLFSLMALVCVGCDRGTESTQAAREPLMTDSQLETMIQDKLSADPALSSARLLVDADASDNTATLSGTVDNEAAKNKATIIAENAHPGLLVKNIIEVMPRELTRAEWSEEHARQERERARQNNDTIGSTLDDAWIHSKIVAKLIADTQTPERNINVDVDNNTVTLRGNVDTAAQKSEAGRIAKETDGVKRVVNQLKIQRR